MATKKGSAKIPIRRSTIQRYEGLKDYSARLTFREPMRNYRGFDRMPNPSHVDRNQF
jgi:hypothetical protein